MFHGYPGKSSTLLKGNRKGIDLWERREETVLGKKYMREEYIKKEKEKEKN